MSSNPSPSSGRLTRSDEIAPGEHYWVKVSRDLRHRLNEAIPHETLKELHRKSPARHLADRGPPVRAAARGLGRSVDLPAALDLDPGGAGLRLDDLQLHGAPARGRAPRDLQRTEPPGRPHPRHPLRDTVGALGPAVHALAPDAPRRARGRRGGPEASLPLAQDQQALVQAALLHAGALPDLLPRGAQGERELSARAAPPDRRRAVVHDRLPSPRHGPALRVSAGRAFSRASTSCRSSSCSRSPSR